MTAKLAVLVVLCGAMLVGCASTSNTSGRNTATAGSDAASGAVGVEGVVGTGGTQEAQAPDIAAQCRTGVESFIYKNDGTLEVLTQDGLIYRVDGAGAVQRVGQLKDQAQNYQLLTGNGVILHYYSDRVMLESLEGQEFFRMAADPSKRQTYFSRDAGELAMLNTNGKFNVWKAEKLFVGVGTHERVQDFFNRQSPDHQLGFPGIVRSLGIGQNGQIAVAMDTPEDGKVGLLYLLDSVKAPGALKNMGRTNTPVKEVAISSTAEYLAAIDELGQFYFTSTTNKGFVVFGQAYKDVKDVTMQGNDPVLVRSDRVVALDHRTGMALYEIVGKYDACEVYGAQLYCAGEGVLGIYQAQDDKMVRRYGFKGETYSMLEQGVFSGTCQ